MSVFDRISHNTYETAAPLTEEGLEAAFRRSEAYQPHRPPCTCTASELIAHGWPPENVQHARSCPQWTDTSP